MHIKSSQTHGIIIINKELSQSTTQSEFESISNCATMLLTPELFSTNIVQIILLLLEPGFSHNFSVTLDFQMSVW